MNVDVLLLIFHCWVDWEQCNSFSSWWRCVRVSRIVPDPIKQNECETKLHCDDTRIHGPRLLRWAMFVNITAAHSFNLVIWCIFDWLSKGHLGAGVTSVTHAVLINPFHVLPSWKTMDDVLGISRKVQGLNSQSSRRNYLQISRCKVLEGSLKFIRNSPFFRCALHQPCFNRDPWQIWSDPGQNGTASPVAGWMFLTEEDEKNVSGKI